jgi:hypothetical protein
MLLPVSRHGKGKAKIFPLIRGNQGSGMLRAVLKKDEHEERGLRKHAGEHVLHGGVTDSLCQNSDPE